MSAACKHEFTRELSRTTEGPLAILMGCANCTATMVDRPSRKKNGRR